MLKKDKGTKKGKKQKYLGVIVIQGITDPASQITPEVKKQIEESGWKNPTVTSSCITAVLTYPRLSYTHVAYVEYEKENINEKNKRRKIKKTSS